MKLNDRMHIAYLYRLAAQLEAAKENLEAEIELLEDCHQNPQELIERRAEVEEHLEDVRYRIDCF
jgi:hypothetical protein|nr:MAG TPA: hypothetical protein [Caudoviricetes sp.]